MLTRCVRQSLSHHFGQVHRLVVPFQRHWDVGRAISWRNAWRCCPVGYDRRYSCWLCSWCGAGRLIWRKRGLWIWWRCSVHGTSSCCILSSLSQEIGYARSGGFHAKMVVLCSWRRRSWRFRWGRLSSIHCFLWLAWTILPWGCRSLETWSILCLLLSEDRHVWDLFLLFSGTVWGCGWIWGWRKGWRGIIRSWYSLMGSIALSYCRIGWLKYIRWVRGSCCGCWVWVWYLWLAF